MCDSDVVYAYRSKDGTKRFEVRHKKDRAFWLYLDMLGAGCVWTFKSEFEGLFFLEEEPGGIRKILRKIGTALRVAFEIGDPVIRIDLCCDGYDNSILFSDLRDPLESGYRTAGYLTIRREWWNKALPSDPCSVETCLEILREEFEEDISLDLQRRLFELRFVDDAAGEDYSFGEFTDEALAWEEALKCFPDCTEAVDAPDLDDLDDFVERDFDEDEWYRDQYEKWMERLEREDLERESHQADEFCSELVNSACPNTATL